MDRTMTHVDRETSPPEQAKQVHVHGHEAVLTCVDHGPQSAEGKCLKPSQAQHAVLKQPYLLPSGRPCAVFLPAGPKVPVQGVRDTDKLSCVR